MAFVLALGEVDDESTPTAAGAINFGFPVIADTDIPEILPSGICTYEHVVANVSHRDMPSRAVEVRGVKIRTVGSPFRSGTVRRSRESGSAKRMWRSSSAASTRELRVSGQPSHGAGAGRAHSRGGSRDRGCAGGRAPAAGDLFEVAGRKMQPEFESILERHVHSFCRSPWG